MVYSLFLDDERMPNKVNWIELPLVDWVIVRNFKQFTEVIAKQGLPARVSFDHDLADEHYVAWINRYKGEPVEFKEKTGMDCVKWLVDYCIQHKLPFPEYYLHSANPVGVENMRSYIESFRKSRT